MTYLLLLHRVHLWSHQTAMSHAKEKKTGMAGYKLTVYHFIIQENTNQQELEFLKVRSRSKEQTSCENMSNTSKFLLDFFFVLHASKLNAVHLNRHSHNAQITCETENRSSTSTFDIHYFKLACVKARGKKDHFNEINTYLSHQLPVVVQLQHGGGLAKLLHSCTPYVLCKSQVQVYTLYLKLLILISLSPLLDCNYFSAVPPTPL